MAGLSVAPSKPAVLQPSEQENQLVQGYQKTADALPGALAPIQQKREGIMQDMGAMGAPPSPPQLQDVPQFTPRQVDAGQMMTFATIATALAALGSKATRTGVTGALGAAGSAIDGFNKGNLEQAKLDIENFNTTMRSVIAENQKRMQEYQKVVEDRKLSWNEKVQMLRVLGSQFDDEITLNAAKKGDIKTLLEYFQKNRTAQQSTEVAYERMNATLEAQARRYQYMMEMQRARASNAGIGSSTPLTPKAIDMYAAAFIKDKNAVAGLGRGVQGARDLRAIANRAAELMAANGGKDLTQTRAELRADANSLNKLTMSYDAIEAFEKTAVRNGRSLVDLAEKVDVTGLPVLERWIRAGRQAIAGDPDVSAFHAQMQVYRTEAARILTNPNLTGQLTDSARKEVEEFLSSNDSAEQITRVVGLLERDFENRKGTLISQMDEIRTRMQFGYGAGDKPGTQKPGAATVQRNKSKSGRSIISNDGGKTWEYE